MSHKQILNRRVIVFAFIAIAFFIFIAQKLRLAKFEFSMLELMLLLLGIFTLAVGLMVWQVVLPLTKKIDKKNLKNI